MSDVDCAVQANIIIDIMREYKKRVNDVNDDNIRKIIDSIDQTQTNVFHKLFLYCSKLFHPDKNNGHLIEATSDMQKLKNATDYLSEECVSDAITIKNDISTGFEKILSGEDKTEPQAESDLPTSQEPSFDAHASRDEQYFPASPVNFETSSHRIYDVNSDEFYDEQAKRINAINAGILFALKSRDSIANFIKIYSDKRNAPNVFSSALDEFERLNPHLTVGLNDESGLDLDLENLTPIQIFKNFKVQLNCDKKFLANVTSEQVKASHDKLKTHEESRKRLMSEDHPNVNKINRYIPGSLGVRTLIPKDDERQKNNELKRKTLKYDKKKDLIINIPGALGPKMGGSKTRTKRKQNQKRTKRKQRQGRKTRRK